MSERSGVSGAPKWSSRQRTSHRMAVGARAAAQGTAHRIEGLARAPSRKDVLGERQDLAPVAALRDDRRALEASLVSLGACAAQLGEGTRIHLVILRRGERARGVVADVRL